ncbi:hypothetical protein N8I77_003388 [Diaporthe amygdali]|uniref:Uncharacterized protein n=1 Tax=Phomopsis amygdali TaxID=1214568 RepID=A0AAD9SJU3_PHOAM|nr:hypothetical protein N8I77_003388 [Diaporthe amygdali]
MAAANIARPPQAPVQHQPRASGSWDDLLRNKGQDKAQQARARAAQGDRGRRPQSSGGGAGASGRPNSMVNPPMRRMELHHDNQRSSQAFAAHVAALNGKPSPLSREVTLGSDFDYGPEYGMMPEINHYSLNDRRYQPQQAPQPQRPGMYARPRRISSGGPMAPRPGSFHSFDGTVDSQGRATRASSWGGMPVIEEAHAFETFPPAHQPFRNSAPTWQPRRPEPIKAAAPRKPGPNELFNKLPVEVLRLVLEHVRRLHFDDKSSSCATCWMRGCCSVALCNHKLLAVAREALYSDIQLVGKDAQLSKKYKGLHTARLVLLRRTLRANRSLGAVVRSLKVPALPDNAPIEATKYHDMVASVVMACPNLERLDGFYPSYRHGSDSHFLHAMETRRKLKEMTWLIEAVPEASVEHVRSSSRKRAQSMSRKSKRATLAPAPAPADDSIPDHYLTAAHANRFVLRHENWKELTHLTIHCLPGSNMSPHGMIGAALTFLPGIDSLYLSHLPASSFNDDSLLGLPRALKKLSLAHCSGVTTAGLSTFATRAAASSLETLTLIHQNIDSADALVRIFAKLSNLTTFNIVQAAAPAMGDDPFLFMPYLASRSLKKLHWDVFESDAAATRADDILARSIAAGGFPCLRSIRVPNDPEGRFQALCKPQERADLAGDRYRRGLVSQATNAAGANSSSTNLAALAGGTKQPSTDDQGGARSSSDTKDSGKEMLPTREYGSDLHTARLAAQARLEAARRFPRFEANVLDEDGEVVSTEGLAGFIGDAASRICYTLVPDVGGSDARGGLVVMDDLLGDGGEDLFRKGDVSSNAGGGFGTGIAPCCVVPGVPEREAVFTRGKLVKRDTGGKTGKEKEKDKDKDKERDRDGEDPGKAREGCTGRWNSYNSEGLVDKKSASGDRWWHVERGRWRGRVELS